MSKLSFQFIGSDNDDLDPVIRLAAAHPTVFKTVNCYKQAEVMHQLSPSTIIIIRDMVIGESLVEVLSDEAGKPHDQLDPKFVAAQWFEHMLPFIETHPYAYFEGPINEPGDLENVAYLKWLSALYVELQKLMFAEGYFLCIGNFSAHAMLFDKVTPFRPALDLAVLYGNLLGLHGYYSPHLNDAGHENYLFPYRALLKILNAAHGSLPPVVLTEFGIDNALLPGREFDGWQTVPDMTAELYVNQELAWADTELEKDLICLGACVYLWSGWDLDDYIMYNIAKPRKLGYKEYEPVSAGDLLIQHIAAHSSPSLPPTKPPEPPPPPPPLDKLLYDNTFSDFAFYERPEDLAAQPEYTGERKIPVGLELGYKEGRKFGVVHCEAYPSENAATSPYWWRLYCYGPMNAWLSKRVETKPGAVVDIYINARINIPEDNQSGGVLWELAVDPAGGDNPFVDGVVAVTTDRHELLTQHVQVKSAADHLTIFWRVYSSYDNRVNFDIDRLSVIEKAAGLPEPEPVPNPPDWEAKTVVSGRWYLRQAPAKEAGNVITVLGGGSELMVGKTEGGYRQVKIGECVIGWIALQALG